MRVWYICVHEKKNDIICVYTSKHTDTGNSGRNDGEIKWHFCVRSTNECSCIRVICMFCTVNVTSIVFVVQLRCVTAAIYSATSFSSGFCFCLSGGTCSVYQKYFPVLCLDSYTYTHGFSLSLSLSFLYLPASLHHCIYIPACNQKVT